MSILSELDEYDLDILNIAQYQIVDLEQILKCLEEKPNEASRLGWLKQEYPCIFIYVLE